MKRLPKCAVLSITTFLLGFASVTVLFFSDRTNSAPVDAAGTTSEIQTPFVGEETQTNESEDSSKSLLDDIWIESEKSSYQGYTITKKCRDKEELFVDNNCELKIYKNKKLLAGFESSRDYWLRHGFFDFLGEDAKQLVVFQYSGGAHCCYDYVIYDLQPAFRVIYNSEKYSSNDQIGNSLKPVDIDKDGIFEFERSVMAFDYFFASHADSVFPPVIFAYEKEKGAYDFANRKFPDFVMNKLKENLDWLSKQREVETESQKRMTDRYILRKNFINLVYAGKEKEAWKYFDENYRFEDKEEFKEALKERFSKEVVYKSIYKSE